MMKTSVLAAVAIALTSSVALAAPGKFGNGHGPRGGVNGYERIAIAKSQASLNSLKRRAWADGRLSFLERTQIRFAEIRHANLVKRYRFN